MAGRRRVDHAAPLAGRPTNPVLDVRNLTVDLPTDDGMVKAVRGLTYQLGRGETLAVVGESGSGKTVGALALLGLLPQSTRIGGQVLFDGVDIAELSPARLRRLRGRRIAMVFQDAMTALNPVRSIGSQLVEVVREHQRVSRSQARTLAIAALDRVHIPQADRRFSAYVHELSGGMRQRVMIAMAIINNPDVLLADEPTTALDVTVAAQILDVLATLRDEDGTAILLITHDLGMVSDFADRVMVMYAGKIAEMAPTRELFGAPEMPYTVGLLACTPSVQVVVDRLRTIPGSPPTLLDPPAGCAFAQRCPLALGLCRSEAPALSTFQIFDPTDRASPTRLHQVACHRSEFVRGLTDPDSIFNAENGVG